MKDEMAHAHHAMHAHVTSDHVEVISFQDEIPLFGLYHLYRIRRCQSGRRKPWHPFTFHSTVLTFFP